MRAGPGLNSVIELQNLNPKTRRQRMSGQRDTVVMSKALQKPGKLENGEFCFLQIDWL